MIDLTPSRFHAVLAAAQRLRAENQLAQLAIVNRGFAGGDGYAELQQQLRQQLET